MERIIRFGKMMSIGLKSEIILTESIRSFGTLLYSKRQTILCWRLNGMNKKRTYLRDKSLILKRALKVIELKSQYRTW